jgi:hypothetical protein
MRCDLTLTKLQWFSAEGDSLAESAVRRIIALQERVEELEAAIETSGFVFRNTDSGPNLVKP